MAADLYISSFLQSDSGSLCTHDMARHCYSQQSTHHCCNAVAVGHNKENLPEKLEAANGVSHHHALRSLSQFVSATAASFMHDEAQKQVHAKIAGRPAAGQDGIAFPISLLACANCDPTVEQSLPNIPPVWVHSRVLLMAVRCVT